MIDGVKKKFKKIRNREECSAGKQLWAANDLSSFHTCPLRFDGRTRSLIPRNRTKRFFAVGVIFLSKVSPVVKEREEQWIGFWCSNLLHFSVIFSTSFRILDGSVQRQLLH
ncbi:hypothetical protein TNCT_450981 [Trichonephila clavata]|uniref:Uncharacterized protein n=1 Tax=Trichonephila clavata TaxID=2740835 RepID=A0A8X6IFK3_TRICU|nr:hypothetical protein TNCT_450981 [Trichonephila clavata]